MQFGFLKIVNRFDQGRRGNLPVNEDEDVLVAVQASNIGVNADGLLPRHRPVIDRDLCRRLPASERAGRLRSQGSHPATEALPDDEAQYTKHGVA